MVYVSDETLTEWVRRFNELETKQTVWKHDLEDLKREILLIKAGNKVQK